MNITRLSVQAMKAYKQDKLPLNMEGFLVNINMATQSCLDYNLCWDTILCHKKVLQSCLDRYVLRVDEQIGVNSHQNWRKGESSMSHYHMNPIGEAVMRQI